MKNNQPPAANRIAASRPGPWPTLLSGLLLLLAGLAHAQAPATLRKDLKKDFGAVGDGRTNDQAAFDKATAFFNQRATTPAGAGPAVLTIPKGTYLVSGQDAAGHGLGVLTLSGCRNLRVEGADSATTEISYPKGLRYGSFDPKTRQVFEAPAAFFVDRSYAADVGTCLVLSQCDNVSISGLSINGNSASAVVGGHWGDTGIQLNYDGVFVSGSRRITLRGLALHHLGRDGIQVLNNLTKSLDDPQQESILLDGLSCRYNGRQGLSITGANGLRAVNCDFSHTGRVLITALGRALVSNPGAGVDIEPEGGFVTNVRFDNCRFVDNAGQGLVSDRQGNAHTVKNIVVANSLLWGTTNWSAWVTHPGFLFQNSRIYGAFVHGCQAENAAEATRFVGCTFEDRPYHGQPAYGPFTLHSDGVARRMSFVDCRFVAAHNYLIHAIPNQRDTADTFHFRNCAFVLDYQEPPQGSYDKIIGSVFSGNNVVQNGPHRTSPHRTDFLLGGGNELVSTVLRAPGSLRLQAPNSYYLVEGNFDIGRNPAHPRDAALVEVSANNALVVSASAKAKSELYIGPASQLVIKKGGALEILRFMKVTIEGRLVVEDGAYFFLDPQAVVQVKGKGQLVVGPQVIKTKHPTLYSTYY